MRITLRGVTTLGTPTATGPNPWSRRSEEHPSTGPAHPPCSRLDVRLAVAVASRAGGLLHHLLQPSPPTVPLSREAEEGWGGAARSCLLLQLSSQHTLLRPCLLFRTATIYLGVGKFLVWIAPERLHTRRSPDWSSKANFTCAVKNCKVRCERKAFRVDLWTTIRDR